MRNVRKRVALNCPEDILDAEQFINAVNDLLEGYRVTIAPLPTHEFGTGAFYRFSEKQLLWMVRHGLLYPSYIIHNYSKAGRPRGPIRGILPSPQLIFDQKGALQNIVIPRPTTKQCHPLRWYKNHGFLVEHPSPQEVLHAWPHLILRKRRGQLESSIEDIGERGIVGSSAVNDTVGEITFGP